MSRRTVRRTYQRALSLVLASTLAASVGAALPAAAETTDSETTVSTQQEDTAPAGDTPEPEEPGLFQGLVQGIAQAFSEPSVTGLPEDSGWGDHVPENPRGGEWTYVEPITDDYHENYFNIANVKTQSPVLHPTPYNFDSLKGWLGDVPAVEGVTIDLVTTDHHSFRSELDDPSLYAWLEDGLDYVSDVSDHDGIGFINTTVSLQVEAGEARTLRLVGHDVGSMSFCSSAENLAVTAVSHGSYQCEFQIPEGTSWTAERRISYSNTGSASNFRNAMPLYTSVGDYLTRPYSMFVSSVGEAYMGESGTMAPGLNRETGEGSFTIRVTGNSLTAPTLVIHAADFPDGTVFSLMGVSGVKESGSDDVVLTRDAGFSLSFGDAGTTVTFKVPEETLPSLLESYAAGLTVGFSMESASALSNRTTSLNFLDNDSKLILNLGTGRDLGSFHPKDVREVNEDYFGYYPVTSFPNNNWARISWVENVREKGFPLTKTILKPSLGRLDVSAYEALTYPSSRQFSMGANGYQTSLAGGDTSNASYGVLSELLGGKARILSSSVRGGAHRAIAHDFEFYPAVYTKRETYGENGLKLGDDFALCDVWDTNDAYYDDNRPVLTPEGATLYYTTTERVRRTGEGFDVRVGECGDYRDESVWSTEKPGDTRSITGVVSVLTITEDMLEGDLVDHYMVTPMKTVLPHEEGAPAYGDLVPDWYAMSTGESVSFGSEKIASARLVAPPEAPTPSYTKTAYATESHAMTANSRDVITSQRRGSPVFYNLSTSMRNLRTKDISSLEIIDILPRCLDNVEIPDHTMENYELVEWRHQGEAVCGDDSSPEEMLVFRPHADKVTYHEVVGEPFEKVYRAEMPSLIVKGVVPINAAAPFTNSMRVERLSPDGSPIVGAHRNSTVNVAFSADTGLVKTVDRPVIELGDPLSWTVSALNETSSRAGDTYLVDILPRNGLEWANTVSGETHANNYTGELNVTGVRVMPGSAPGVTLEFTDHDPELMDVAQPRQEGVEWVFDADDIGGYDNVTAIRIFIPDLGHDGSTLAQVKIQAHPKDTVTGDVLVNKLGRGDAENLTLDLGDPQPVRTEVVASTVEGTLWNDQNRDAVRDEDEPGLSDTEVTLCRLDGPEANGPQGPWTTRTDEEGRYLFDNLHSGTYVVSLAGCEATEDTEVPEGFPLSDLEGFEQTYSYQGNTFEESAVVAHLRLGIQAQQRKVDFGFYSEDNERGIAFALPDTGDGAALWVLLLLSGGAAAGVVVFLVRRHRSSGDYLPEEVVKDQE